jgi:hypothetical protein
MRERAGELIWKCINISNNDENKQPSIMREMIRQRLEMCI